jgi:hypothetical protein
LARLGGFRDYRQERAPSTPGMICASGKDVP